MTIARRIVRQRSDGLPPIATRQLECLDRAGYKVVVVVVRSAYIEDDVANSKTAHLRSDDLPPYVGRWMTSRLRCFGGRGSSMF